MMMKSLLVHANTSRTGQQLFATFATRRYQHTVRTGMQLGASDYLPGSGIGSLFLGRQHVVLSDC